MQGKGAPVPRISSALGAVELRQAPPPLIIGERVNTQGSARAKRMVLADDYDGLVGLAREQVDDGAHCLDICVATNERDDEMRLMVSLVKRISMEVAAPLVIDSTDPDVVEAAIRQIPGRPMINSINLEGDGSRFARLAPVMARYGVPAVAMCIGPDGMAKTPEQKLRTAEMLVEEGRKYGLREDQFVFDVITFTLGTGEAEFAGAGANTLEGIGLVRKRFPAAFTTLGLSNISFGLDPAARRVINSAFLHHAVVRGLDSAIVNAREIVPYAQLDEAERRLADDLVFNRSPDALPRLIDHFEAGGGRGGGGGGGRARGPEVDPSWPAGRRARFRIVNRLKDGLREDVVEAIAAKIGREASVRPRKRDGEEDAAAAGGGGGKAAVLLDEPPEATHEGAIRTLNEDLLPAMKEVGDLFGSGQLILPFVLKSAECMKAAVSELEGYLLKDEAESASKGRLVLGTVYGDVHDIGKNLVRTIFENNGYEVHDLGKQVPLQKFLDKIEEVRPDAVGLSALLVSTSQQMGLFVEHARGAALDVPVLCGGAAVNADFVGRIATKGGVYEPGVFYCATMFDGLRTMDALVSDGGAGRAELLGGWRRGLEQWKAASEERERRRLLQAGAEKAASAASAAARSPVEPVADPPRPPSLGVRARLGPADIDLGQVWPLLDKRSLFKMSWGLRGRAGQESEADHERLLEEWKARVASERLFEPAAVYGYFECRGAGDHLEVDVPGRGSGGSGGGERTVSFDFPRSSRHKRLCLADYFGGRDTVAFQAVTVGARASAVLDEWNAQDRYSDAYYLHGLAVETAEALAGWVHGRVRADLGLGPGRGLRYSWGYPSCPDVGQHRLVWDLLSPDESGMTLTSAGQIVPEQSTAAIVVHHPGAEYFGL